MKHTINLVKTVVIMNIKIFREKFIIRGINAESKIDTATI